MERDSGISIKKREIGSKKEKKKTERFLMKSLKSDECEWQKRECKVFHSIYSPNFSKILWKHLFMSTSQSFLMLLTDSESERLQRPKAVPVFLTSPPEWRASAGGSSGPPTEARSGTWCTGTAGRGWSWKGSCRWGRTGCFLWTSQSLRRTGDSRKFTKIKRQTVTCQNVSSMG